MSAPALITGKFTDSDEFCAAAAGLNMEFSQLDCGKLDARLALTIGRRFVVQHFSIGRRFHQRGAAPDGQLTFGLPDDFSKLIWYGRPVERESVLNFSRRDGFDAVTDYDFTGYTFSIGSTDLQNAVTALDDSLSSEQIRDMVDHFAASSDELRGIRSVANGMRQYVDNAVVVNGAYDELEADLAHMLARCVCDSPDADMNSSFAQRQVAVNRALELILSTHDAITVSDVYKYSAVSWRTLDRAFKERFGVSPKQYIVAARMVGVRRSLVAAPQGTKVTDVANDWGFWHLGRFASDYKRMFGELPSQTLVAA
jgi:AraC family ethanolamine operon transcriptional activator